MLGKAMNEFRRTTDDFKETWAREVDSESGEKRVQPELSALSTTENSILRTDATMKNEIVAPEIKEISQTDFQTKLPEKESALPKKAAGNLTEKHEWL